MTLLSFPAAGRREKTSLLPNVSPCFPRKVFKHNDTAQASLLLGILKRKNEQESMYSCCGLVVYFSIFLLQFKLFSFANQATNEACQPPTSPPPPSNKLINFLLKKQYHGAIFKLNHSQWPTIHPSIHLPNSCGGSRRK